MLINVDVKSLEVYVACDLSGDKTLYDELMIPGNDMHTNNQNAFGLPSRVIAKIFVFKLLYGASAYGYANDPDFVDVSRRDTFWQEVIDNFYAKYPSIALWHKKLIKEAQTNGFLSIPSGRYYPIDPIIRAGRVKWPETIIKNYPVQGFGADLVKLARIETARRFRQEVKRGVLVGTIHDSIVADVPEDEVELSCKIMKESIAKVPELCYNIYKYKFSLPMLCEVQVGPNKNDMKEFHFDAN